MRTIATITILVCTLAAYSQDARIERVRQFETYGYTQSVRVGNVIYLSGITGMGPMDQPLQGVYARIGQALREAGTDFAHVVKENLYTTDIEAAKANNAVRMKFYDGSFPAATWVQVERLFMPDYNVEVEVIAILPEQQ